MYNKVDTNMNFVDREKETEKFWRENDIFKKSMENRKEGETYTFYDGPPTANGKPHIGHVETRTIKDMIPRFQTMKGKYVPRKAGWDTHGLPVEIEVEKLLGLDGKDQIEAYGLEPFIKKCKESVWKYKGMWEDFSNTVGFWADMDNPYVTYDDNFIESEWWALKEIWNKGLLYKGFKIVPYCPRCGTPLSAQEVAQGYKLIKVPHPLNTASVYRNCIPNYIPNYIPNCIPICIPICYFLNLLLILSLLLSLMYILLLKSALTYFVPPLSCLFFRSKLLP